MIPISVPRETVNDETVIVHSWHVSEGEQVEAQQVLAELETSKAAMEIEASHDGYVRLCAQEGDEVPVGSVICYIDDAPDARLPTAAAGKSHTGTLSQTGAESPRHPGTEVGPRFSRRARALINQRGVPERVFAEMPMVTEADVLDYLGDVGVSGRGCTPASHSEEPTRPDLAVPTAKVSRSEKLSRQKLAERQRLVKGVANTVPTVVVVSCAVLGLRDASQSNATIAGNTTGIIVYEVARLLKAYPQFNAFCSGDTVVYYDDINVGFAVDGGEGLKVLAIHHADRKPLEEIVGEMQDKLVAYVDGTLKETDVAGATFTVTDLSGHDVSSFTPLIPGGNSAILGIGFDHPIGGRYEGVYNLILAFDHQVASGAEAAGFLRDLRGKMLAYDRARRDGSTEDENSELLCDICSRSTGELQAIRAHLLKTVTSGGAESYVCSVCLAGW